MVKIRKRYSAELKAKVALAALQEQASSNEIASRYQVHPNQVSQWKRQALEGIISIFSNGRAKEASAQSELVNQLYQQIGQMKVELDWFKKKSGL